MTTARTLVRFVFAGLFVNALAVACVVSDGDDDDDTTACDPGARKDCTCATGDEGTKTCSASGNSYGACDCSATTACDPGSYQACSCASGEDGMQRCSASGVGYGACACSDVGSGGSGGGGEGNTAAGAGGTSVGGAGGEASGGMSSEGGAAGAGGAPTNPDDVCVLDEHDDCQSCVQIDCCDQWTACRAETEGDCESEVVGVMACAKTERGVDDPVTPAELEDCAQFVAENDVWSAGVLPTTKAVIDCVAGGAGWAAKNSLEGSTCDSLCFAGLVE